MSTRGPVQAVSVISTGTVEIHPEPARGSSKPLYWWLLTSRKRQPARPIDVDVIELSRIAPEPRGYLREHIDGPGANWKRVAFDPTRDPTAAARLAAS